MAKSFKKNIDSKFEKAAGKIVTLGNKEGLTSTPIILRYNGLFDFDSLYAAIIDWTKHNGYRWHEKSFKHKVPSPAGAEQEYSWLLEKNVNDFVKYTVFIDVHAWNLLEISVNVAGKEKSLSNARIEMKIKGQIDFDWQKKFKKGFAKYLGRMYIRIMQKEFEAVYWDQLYYRVWNLHGLIKKYFDMQSKYNAYEKKLGEN